MKPRYGVGIALTFLLFGCASTQPAKSLVGVWDGVFEGAAQVRYEFHADQTVSGSVKSVETGVDLNVEGGHWHLVDENHLRLDFSKPDHSETNEFKLTGDNLQLIGPKGTINLKRMK